MAATYEVCIDWDNNGDFSDTYDDVSANVKSIHFSRGKSDELGKADTGQCSITLNNANGLYTPSNSGGALYGKILPKRPLRVRATISPTTYGLFYGYIEEIIPHPHKSEQDCIITATDGLDYLSRQDLSSILIKDQTTGYIHKNILFDAGWGGLCTTDGLVLYVPLWNYDLNTSSFISKDNYRNSCTVGGSVWSSLGYTFGGVDDYIEVAHDASHLLTTGGSIEAWIKPDVENVAMCIVDKSASWVGGNGYSLLVSGANNSLGFNINNGPVRYTTAGAYTIGNWYHVVATWDNTGLVTCYINGSQSGTPGISADPVGITTTNALRIGSRSGATDRTFNGTISDVRIYNVALTPTEILQNYNATKWFYTTSIDTGQDTVPYWYGHDAKSRYAQAEIDDSEQGFSYVDGSGYFNFEDRHHRSTATHQTSQATFDNTMSNIEYNLNPKNVYNIVKVTVTPWELQSITELWRLEDTPRIPAGETYTYWADSSVNGNSVFVDAWSDINDGDTDFTANSQSDGGGTDMTSDVSVTETKFAKTMKIQLENTASVPAYVTLLKARGTYYDDQTKVTLKAEDSTSQTAYQKRTYELDGKYMTDSDKARDYVTYAIGKYKNPRAELSMSVMNQDSTILASILGLEISDRITVVNTELGLNDDYFIDYMEHDISMGGKLHTATYRLADSINEDFWCLDFSALASSSTEGQTKLGY